MKIDVEELKRIAWHVSKNVKACHMLNTDDIYAAAMVGAWKGHLSYDPENTTKRSTWLKTKAYFEVMDERRRFVGRETCPHRNYGQMDLSLDELTERGSYRPSCYCSGLAEVESTDAVNFILKELHIPRMRLAMVLRYLHGMTLVEIGKIFGVTDSAMSVPMKQAREHLASVLRHTPASTSCGTL